MRLGSVVRKLTSEPWAAVALLACLLPLSAFVFHGSGPDEGGTFRETLYNLVMLLIGVPILAVVIAWPQVVMYFLVRSVPVTAAKAVGSASSLMISIWYTVWAANADLTGSSTASLALIFYPIMVQWWAWLLALGAVLLAVVVHNQRPNL